MRITTNTHFKAFKPKVHGPDQHSPQAFGTLEMDAGTGIDYASIYLHSEAECDELIKAACALKDMMHAANQAAAMADPLAPLRDREHYAAAQCPAKSPDDGDGTHACDLIDGHDGRHEAYLLRYWDTTGTAPERTATTPESNLALGPAECGICRTRHWNRDACPIPGPVLDDDAAEALAVRVIEEWRTATPAERTACPAHWGGLAEGQGVPAETAMPCELDAGHPGLHENGGIEWGGHAERITDVMAQAYVNTGLHADALAAERLAGELARRPGANGPDAGRIEGRG